MMRSQTCWVVGCSSSVERAIRHHLAAIGAGCSPGDQLPGRRPFLRRSAAKPEGGDGPHNKVIAASNARCAERMHPYPAIAPAWVDFVQRAAMAQLIEAEAGDAPMIGEKTPNNVLELPRLATLYPTARVLVMLRDGCDCAVSTWFFNLHLYPEEAMARYPRLVDFLEVFASSWASYVDLGLRFAGTFPDRCLTLTYEALLTAGGGADPGASVPGCLVRDHGGAHMSDGCHILAPDGWQAARAGGPDLPVSAGCGGRLARSFRCSSMRLVRPSRRPAVAALRLQANDTRRAGRTDARRRRAG